MIDWCSSFISSRYSLSPTGVGRSMTLKSFACGLAGSVCILTFNDSNPSAGYMAYSGSLFPPKRVIAFLRAETVSSSGVDEMPITAQRISGWDWRILSIASQKWLCR